MSGLGFSVLLFALVAVASVEGLVPPPCHLCLGDDNNFPDHFCQHCHLGELPLAMPPCKGNVELLFTTHQKELK